MMEYSNAITAEEKAAWRERELTVTRECLEAMKAWALAGTPEERRWDAGNAGRRGKRRRGDA
jgi:hypothetical protein